MSSLEFQQKTAATGLVVTWAGWIVSHADQVNGILQTVLLLVSIAAGVVTTLLHWKRFREHRSK